MQKQEQLLHNMNTLIVTQPSPEGLGFAASVSVNCTTRRKSRVRAGFQSETRKTTAYVIFRGNVSDSVELPGFAIY